MGSDPPHVGEQLHCVQTASLYDAWYAGGAYFPWCGPTGVPHPALPSNRPRFRTDHKHLSTHLRFAHKTKNAEMLNGSAQTSTPHIPTRWVHKEPMQHVNFPPSPSTNTNRLPKIRCNQSLCTASDQKKFSNSDFETLVAADRRLWDLLLEMRNKIFQF